MFKKVYLEITNACNLKCSFCALNKREKKFLSLENLDIILNKLDGYTKYLYFHVMGEPLLHPNINELIDRAHEKGFNVNLTTNGYLIKNIENNTNVRQLNISLHSFDIKNGITLDEYMNNIFGVVSKLVESGTYIKYRMWVNSEYKYDILGKLEEYYNISKIDGNMKMVDNVYFEEQEQFIWPDCSNAYYSEKGTCMGLRTHIGILVDGTIVPCCLDNNGVIKLGNIYKNTIDDIINSDLFVSMKNGFLNNKKIMDLCRHCSFYDVRKNNED